jgi:sarcosine oxidase, subunit alpha
MAKRLRPAETPITIDLDGHGVAACAGEPLAVSLIAANEGLLSRSIKYHRPRGAFCLTGGCGQCLMRVDGVPNVAACQVPARIGQQVAHQNAFPDVRVDLFQATDWAFPKWFNHHEFLAGVPLAETMMAKIARQLAGLGLLPERPAPPPPPPEVMHVDIVIVGCGASGTAAAMKLSERKANYVVLERDAMPGGRLLLGLENDTPAHLVEAQRIRTQTTVVGLWADDGRPFLLATTPSGRALLVFYRQVILTNGGQPTLLAFENNDLPGIYAGRAVASLVNRWGVSPGKRVAVVGDTNEAKTLAHLLERVGCDAIAVGRHPLKAHGLNAVQAITVDGPKERVDCDAVAICAAPSPSFELARAAGAEVRWLSEQQRFAVATDHDGQTTANGVFAAGELRGPMSAATAWQQGLVAADAALRVRSGA